jgi:hypothetical protein
MAHLVGIKCSGPLHVIHGMASWLAVIIPNVERYGIIWLPTVRADADVALRFEAS